MIEGLKELDTTHPELSASIDGLLKELFNSSRDEITKDWGITDKADNSYIQEPGQADNIFSEFFRRAHEISTAYAKDKGIENEDFGFGLTEE